MNKKNLESGQGLPEYAFLYSFVALLFIVLLFVFGDQVRATYQFFV